jgi:hypothetical protein
MTALYRYFDEGDVLLYAGISDHLPVREASHVKSSAWMSLAVRSTIERHPSRDAALTAERTAIETEHPIFNKQYNDTPEAAARLERYLAERGIPDLLAISDLEVSIPLHRFLAGPDERLQSEPRAEPAPQPTSDPRPAWADEANWNAWQYREARRRGLDPYTLIPNSWPRGMWARVWLETFEPGYVDVVCSILCREEGPLTGYKVCRNPEEYGHWEATWAQRDNPKAFGPTLRLESPWSAHNWQVGESRELRPRHEELQQKFLNALHSRERCLRIQSSTRAAAWGFGSSLEAQCAGAVLAELRGGYRHSVLQACFAITAILRAPRPDEGYGCPKCRRVCVDDGSRELFCWRCRARMINLEKRSEPRRGDYGIRWVYDFPDEHAA